MVVIWSPRARKRLRTLYNYFFEVAGERTVHKMVGKITVDAKRLAGQPLMGAIEPQLEPDALRRIIVCKNYKLIYRIEGETVYIVALFDCRQHPEKILK